MPTFKIERQFPREITEDEALAGTYRALACLGRFPGVEWVRSYWDDTTKTSWCIYNADNPEIVRLHAMSANIPCDAITEVMELDPSVFAMS